MASQGEIEALLATWREVSRSLAQAEPGTPEHERLTDDAFDLEYEYRRLVGGSEIETALEDWPEAV